MEVTQSMIKFKKNIIQTPINGKTINLIISLKTEK